MANMLAALFTPLTCAAWSRRSSGKAATPRNSPSRAFKPGYDVDETESTITSVHAEDIARVFLDKKQKTMTLFNFVEKSEPRDSLLLKETLESSRRKWQCVKFEDTIHGSKYRRWAYKKTAVCRRFFNATIARGVPVVFETKVLISDMTPKSIISILRELQKDVDVTALEISAMLDYQDAWKVLNALIALLVHDDRQWISIDFHVVFGSSMVEESDDNRKSQRWMGKYMGCLELLSLHSNIPIVARTEYNL